MRGDYTADPTAGNHGGDPNSTAAHESIRSTKRLLRDRIVAHVAGLDFGATSDEIEQQLDLPHQTVSARITEAKARGELIPSGWTRRTRQGRSAAVLVTPDSTGRLSNVR
jgi:hypothetical protein